MNQFYVPQKSKAKKNIAIIFFSIIVVLFAGRVLLYYLELKEEENKHFIKNKVTEVEKPIEIVSEKSKLMPENTKNKEVKVEKSGINQGKMEFRAQNVNFTNLQNFGKANYYFKKGSFREAIKVLDKIKPKTSKMKKLEGLSYYNLAQYHKTIEILKEPELHEKEDFVVLKYLGLSYYEREDFVNTIKWIDKALTVKKDANLLNIKNRVLKEKKNRKHYGVNNRVNFKVIYSKLEHSSNETRIVAILENAYREICQKLNYYPNNITEIVLYTQKSFFDITRSPGWAGGLFDGRIRIPVKNMTEDPSNLKRILYHEFAHSVVYKITSSCPVWLDEGLAEYLSQDYSIQTLGQVIPLEYLENTFPNSGNAVPVAYRESYSVVKYLVDRYGMYRIKSLLEKLGQGQPFSKAFNSEFMISYKKFVGEWGKVE